MMYQTVLEENLNLSQIKKYTRMKETVMGRNQDFRFVL